MIVEIIKGTSPVEVGIGLIREDLEGIKSQIRNTEDLMISVLTALEKRLVALENRKGFWAGLWERIRASIKF